jgi:hypothetical protein
MSHLDDLNDHQDYINDMFFRIAMEKDLEEEEEAGQSQIPPALLSLLENTESNVSLETELRARRIIPSRGDTTKAPSRAPPPMKKIEVPWRSKSTFTSPSQLQSKAFENFRMVRKVQRSTVPDTELFFTDTDT